MTKQSSELIPKKTEKKLKEILTPLSPDSSEAAIRFLADEITRMFRELSEKRSSSEGEARQTLARREANILKKLQELFPDAQAQIEDAYAIMLEALETQFDRQKGKKYL